MGGASARGRGGDQSARSGGGTARSGQLQHYSGMDPAIVASKAVEVMLWQPLAVPWFSLLTGALRAARAPH